MKIIQISDPHLVEPGRRLWRLDPAERLRRCLADIGIGATSPMTARAFWLGEADAETWEPGATTE